MTSKIFRCIDCGKEYYFDYTDILPDIDPTDEINFNKKVTNYISTLNFPDETNICLQCLKNVQTIKSNSNQKNANKSEIPLTKKYIDELNEKFEKEQDLETYNEKEEKNQEEELKKLKNKIQEDENKLNSLLKELEKMEEEETKFCDEFRDVEIKLYLAEMNKANYSELIDYYKNKINKINANNIFTELFQISFNEKYPTINGCKFCDPYISNNYDSINGGWGYIILLTKLLTIKYMFDSATYELLPEGNFSKIKIKANVTEYELGISDMNRTIEKFNQAMEIYLKYLSEFWEFLIKEKKIDVNGANELPKINGNIIKDKSIVIEDGKDRNMENWYQCMKYLLTILKFLVCQTLSNENTFIC